MKVRNLLLAGLAVAAMTACSNNEIDEIVDNGNQTPTEEASMRINLKFANEITTRANSGDQEAGEGFERTSNTVTAIIEYPNTDKRLVYKNLELVAGTEGTYQTTPFSVSAGSNVKVYAIINYSEDASNNLDTDKLADLTVGAQSLPEAKAGLAYIANTVAKEHAFLMSGKVENVNIEAGKADNKAEITVDRVAAKLNETTAIADPFVIKDGQQIYNTSGEVSIQLLGFSYSNLSSDSYIFGGKTSASTWLQEYVPEGQGSLDGTDYRWITDKITYCLENNTLTNPTKVHYKGQVCIDGVALNDEFYIRAEVLNGKTSYYLFTSWTALTDHYNDNTIKGLDKEDTALLAKYGISKYKGGICYYEANIETYAPVASTSVLRNNWYQLSVSKISKIGFPTPAPDVTPDPDETMLNILTTVKDWTIQVNDYEL